jgi:hypothetical protein
VALAAVEQHMKPMASPALVAQVRRIKAVTAVAVRQTYLVAAVVVLVLLVHQHQVQKLAELAATVLHPLLLVLRLQEQVVAVEVVKVLEEQVALVVVAVVLMALVIQELLGKHQLVVVVVVFALVR